MSKDLMRISKIKIRYLLIALLIIPGLYSILPGFFFSEESNIPVVSTLNTYYLNSIRECSNLILKAFGSGTLTENNQFINDSTITGFVPFVRFRKTMVIFMIFIWITRTRWESKALFTFFLTLMHFFINSIYLAAGAYLSTKNDYTVLISFPETGGYLFLFTIIFLWFRSHKQIIFPRLSKFKINAALLQNDTHTIVFAYSFILLYYLFYNIFDYHNWIGFLFGASQKILGILGHTAFVEPNYLVGDKGSIFMLKSCIGYQTILLFAVFIILTGNTGYKVRWLYILSGFMLLNLANILRFVLLFLHIQKHGDYMLTLNVHDMYNYIIYAIVLILWIIWFEKFSEYPRQTKIKAIDTVNYTDPVDAKN